MRVGLTGGIASGKSQVADLFAARGASVAVFDDDSVVATALRFVARDGREPRMATAFFLRTPPRSVDTASSEATPDQTVTLASPGWPLASSVACHVPRICTPVTVLRTKRVG